MPKSCGRCAEILGRRAHFSARVNGALRIQLQELKGKHALNWGIFFIQLRYLVDSDLSSGIELSTLCITGATRKSASWDKRHS